ncbi:phage tail protein [Swingsia samuiensis]|uniref:Phage tail protein n=1 Tax=Swingsia samuiensis TaxID=1293412 RepID=A0A4Y6UGT1_9PROT|nr:phage tail protein [Swingsia samuiensis]QDH16779.1 phage tail protein [Swingsia samuiensis]
MSSLSHWYGQDLSIDKDRLKIVSGAEEVQQRLLRRLLTNSGDCIWQPKYGAGVRKMVGQVLRPGMMQASIRAEVLQDSGVDSSKPVEVIITDRGGGGCDCQISYFDNENNEKKEINFPIL